MTVLDFPRPQRPSVRNPPKNVRIMPCACESPELDRLLGPHQREFHWIGPRSAKRTDGGWCCSTCGRRKPGSTEGDHP